ncbi:hypothetical protein KFE94_05040 [bacterium SCSIO 12643]|nr:hypothetical protein KFE94_05040 [bacterium SCSIO 12643]
MLYLKNISLAILFSTTISLLHAQKIKVSEVTITPGVYSEGNPSATVNDFYALAPNSQLLPGSLNGYKTYGSSNNGGFTSSILLGFQFLNKDQNEYKANPLLRVGVTFKSGDVISASIFKETRTTIDTLISQSNGQKYPLDSISYEAYGLNYHSQQIKLDASLIFRTNPKSRWYLFGGFGGTIGTSINNKTTINYHQFNYSSPENEDVLFLPNNPRNHNSQNESFVNQNSMVYSIYVPLGVDFRISNNNEFWKRIHLFYEMQPTINFTPVPELRTFTNMAFQNNLGIKVSWL